jgi:hypothetical protein
MKNFVTCLSLLLVLNMSLCLNLRLSVYQVSNETITNSTKTNEIVTPFSNNENLSEKCKNYKDAKQLNFHLNNTVEQLHDLIKDHANMSLSRAANLSDIDNSYSKFPVNNTKSYKKFLEDLYTSYESGFYNDKIKKLKHALDIKKFPISLEHQCYNFTDADDSTSKNSTNNENKNNNSTSTNTSKKDNEDFGSNVFFLQNKSKLVNTNNLKKMNLMSLKDLYNKYSILLEKSKKLLI